MKYVPDAVGDRCFAEDATTDRESVDGLLSELDEYAVEQALQIADDADDAEITALTVGPEDAKDALRKTLSMGADNGRKAAAESGSATGAKPKEDLQVVDVAQLLLDSVKTPRWRKRAVTARRRMSRGRSPRK